MRMLINPECRFELIIMGSIVFWWGGAMAIANNRANNSHSQANLVLCEVFVLAQAVETVWKRLSQSTKKINSDGVKPKWFKVFIFYWMFSPLAIDNMYKWLLLWIIKVLKILCLSTTQFYKAVLRLLNLNKSLPSPKLPFTSYMLLYQILILWKIIKLFVYGYASLWGWTALVDS